MDSAVEHLPLKFAFFFYFECFFIVCVCASGKSRRRFEADTRLWIFVSFGNRAHVISVRNPFRQKFKKKREKNRNPTSWSDGEFGAVSIRRKFSFLGGDKKGQQRWRMFAVERRSVKTASRANRTSSDSLEDNNGGPSSSRVPLTFGNDGIFDRKKIPFSTLHDDDDDDDDVDGVNQICLLLRWNFADPLRRF